MAGLDLSDAIRIRRPHPRAKRAVTLDEDERIDRKLTGLLVHGELESIGQQLPDH